MQSILAVVNLNEIRKNARAVLRYANKPLIAVVKDDAYGHGAEQVAHALHGVAAAFAVATVEEGARLRSAGISEPILVLTPPLAKEEALKIAAYGLTATASSFRSLDLLAGLGEVEAHLAVNTGMNRYGFRADRVEAALREAAKKNVKISGVYSHLYAPEDDAARNEQKKRFFRAAAQTKRYFPEAKAHLSATGGMLAGDDFDAVRVGLALYGYLPEGQKGLSVTPALKIYAAVAENRVRFGSGAGYQRAAEDLKELHTLRLGYGDGFFREGGLGAFGKLCMDACVRKGYAPVGKRVLVLENAAAYAAEHGTTAYEVLVNVTKKAEMYYIF